MLRYPIIILPVVNSTILMFRLNHGMFHNRLCWIDSRLILYTFLIILAGLIDTWKFPQIPIDQYPTCNWLNINFIPRTTRKNLMNTFPIACLPSKIPPSHWEITSYLEVYSSRPTLYRCVALLAGMYRQHLPGLRIGILSVHRGTRRSPDQKLRTLLQIARRGSTVPVRDDRLHDTRECSTRFN